MKFHVTHDKDSCREEQKHLNPIGTIIQSENSFSHPTVCWARWREIHLINAVFRIIGAFRFFEVIEDQNSRYHFWNYREIESCWIFLKLAEFVRKKSFHAVFQVTNLFIHLLQRKYQLFKTGLIALENEEILYYVENRIQTNKMKAVLRVWESTKIGSKKEKKSSMVHRAQNQPENQPRKRRPLKISIEKCSLRRKVCYPFYFSSFSERKKSLKTRATSWLVWFITFRKFFEDVFKMLLFEQFCCKTKTQENKYFP